MRQSDVVDRILSLCAIVAAVAAVAVSVYEARIDRAHQRVSVWPYVSQYNSNEGGSYLRVVSNVGLGPALVRSFQVRVDGRTVRSWSEAITALTGEPRGPRAAYTYGSLGRGHVLLPGAPYTLLRMPLQPTGQRFHQGVDRMSTRVCYCSLYEECWTSDSRADEPERVRACPTDRAAEFDE